MITPIWALENLANKDDVHRLEIKINEITKENAEIRIQQARHEEQLEYLLRIDERGRISRRQMVTWILGLAAPVATLVSLIFYALKK